jgi:hypothetical protein
MKRACLPAAVLAAALAMSPSTLAQAPIEKDSPKVSATVKLTLEQRHIIRELVREQKSTNAIVDGKLSAGDAVPNGVESQPMPSLVGSKVPQVKSHRFFVTAQQIAIVDPKENTVVEVID